METPEYTVSWTGAVNTPHRGLLCSPEAIHETKPAPPINRIAGGHKATATALANGKAWWGINAHLLDGETEVKTPKPEGKRSRKRLPVEAVRTLLQTRAYTIAEMMAALNATEWQIRNSFRAIGTGWILSRTCESVDGYRPPSQFWMSRP